MLELSWFGLVGRAYVLSHAVRQWHAQSWTWAQSMLVAKSVDKNSSAAMLAIKRSAGVAPKVNLRSPLCTGYESQKWTQGRCYQKPKIGVSMAHKKGLVSSIKF